MELNRESRKEVIPIMKKKPIMRLRQDLYKFVSENREKKEPVRKSGEEKAPVR